MKYVGVDVAKETHYACVTSQSNKILTPPFPFENNIAGFNLFLSKFKKFPKNDVVIGLESTGVYGENLMAFLSEQGYQVALINPIETAGARRKRIRNAKTDKIDSKAIRLLESQLDDTENRLKELWNSIDTVIKSIPGIGTIDGALIYSEIGDIKRFHKPDQLIAFAGLDPATKQSGNFRAESMRMSKRGSPYLRYALVNAAWNVSLNNATFGEYFNLKLSEKGRHYKALGHVAGKLTRVIFKMLKDNVGFNLP